MWQVKRLRHCLIGDLITVHIDRRNQSRIFRASFFQPEIGNGQHVGKCHVAQRVGARSSDSSWHVRDAVVDDSVHHVGRITVRRRATGLNATTLINAHINDDSTRFHVLQVSRSDEIGRLGSGD